MRLAATLFVLLLLPASAAWAQEQIETTFFLPTPEGWRTETLPFPLEFAPELDYEGLEELRFAPGMFEEGSGDFWSYAFIWWVPEGTRLDTERLETDLEIYFRGLTRAVAEAREFEPGDPEFLAELRPVESTAPDQLLWEGTAKAYDVFTTRKPLQLGVRIERVRCAAQGHLAVIFQLSPQPPDHEIWEDLAGIREGFRCERSL